MKSVLRAFATVLLSSVAAFGVDEAKPATTPAKTDAADTKTPAAGVKIYAASDLDGLKAVKGQKIVLEGKVHKLGSNKGETIRYLNFTADYHASASLVFFANAGGGTFTKEKLGEFVGKKVQANGTLSEYNGSLQIKIESLDQIKIVEESAPATATK